MFYLLIICCFKKQTHAVSRKKKKTQQPIVLGALICSLYLLVHNYEHLGIKERRGVPERY